MSSKSGKQKRKIFFIKGDGTFATTPIAPGDKKVESTWNPGRSRNKFRKKK